MAIRPSLVTNFLDYVFRLDKWLGVPYTTVAVPFALFLGGIVLATNYFVPWTTEVVVSLYGYFHFHIGF